ncbi:MULTISPECIES: hypothetical protein [Cyanophyceae]|nr:hypothetical protein [Nodosilinea sp. FACHB-131]
MPAVLGMVPGIISLAAAPREPVDDRMVSFCGSPAVPVVCESL